MSKKAPSEQFEVSSQKASGEEIVIRGRKLAPPAKRIVLAQNGLKIASARISHYGKNGVVSELAVIRMNSLPARNEIRLHTKENLFPGEYEIRLQPR